MEKPPLPENFRLFVAVRLPHPVKMEIERIQTELRQDLKPDSVRWTQGEQLHFTLKFLGNVPLNLIEPLTIGLQAAICPFTPLRLHARQLGFFPEKGLLRVIWIGIEDESKSLGRLHAAIEDAVKPFSSEPPGKPFSGHVTLGRVKHLVRPDVARLQDYAVRHHGQTFGSWTADAIELMQSTLSSTGPHHRPLAIFPPGAV
jgi:2'-5' RNA ligase